jgi:hypothetical protein
MEKRVNSTTGNTDLHFNATLVSISDTPTGETPNGKEYRVATISFKNAAGAKVQRSCLVFENNFKYGMEPGNEYQTRAIFEKGRENPLLVMSHLTGTSRASFDDFGVSAEDIAAVPSENKVGA